MKIFHLNYCPADGQQWRFAVVIAEDTETHTLRRILGQDSVWAIDRIIGEASPDEDEGVVVEAS